MARIVAWDLECSNLNANFGHLICGGMKDIGKGGVFVRSLTDYDDFKSTRPNDKRLAKELRDKLSEADVWVTWYGLRFDVPFLNTRLLYHGLDPLPPIPHVDGWRVARYQMRLNSNRLETVSNFLGIAEKTPLKGPTWEYASAGDEASIRYVIKHCKQDVIVLEQAYQRLLPFISGHPNVALAGGEVTLGAGQGGRTPQGRGAISAAAANRRATCPKCGSSRIQARGWSIARSRRSRRYQCQGCGGWSTGPSVSPGFNVGPR